MLEESKGGQLITLLLLMMLFAPFQERDLRAPALPMPGMVNCWAPTPNTVDCRDSDGKSVDPAQALLVALRANQYATFSEASSSAWSPPPRSSVTWWTVAPSALAKTKHTHVSVTGTVRLVKVEDDGDRHIRLCDAKGCAVAECIPAIPCAAPKVGQRITVKGISRTDRMHRWEEIHPVISWEPAP